MEEQSSQATTDPTLPQSVHVMTGRAGSGGGGDSRFDTCF